MIVSAAQCRPTIYTCAPPQKIQNSETPKTDVFRNWSLGAPGINFMRVNSGKTPRAPKRLKKLLKYGPAW